MDDARCGRCRKALAPGEARLVPRSIALVASFALAFGHGGMWASEELARPYCARCRRAMIAFALFATAVASSLAGVGLRIWLRGPR